jgi:hypothetical protein
VARLHQRLRDVRSPDRGLPGDLAHPLPRHRRAEAGERRHDPLATRDAARTHPVEFHAERLVAVVHEQAQHMDLCAGHVAGEFHAGDQAHTGMPPSSGARLVEAVEGVVVSQGKYADAVGGGEVHQGGG